MVQTGDRAPYRALDTDLRGKGAQQFGVVGEQGPFRRVGRGAAELDENGSAIGDEDPSETEPAMGNLTVMEPADLAPQRNEDGVVDLVGGHVGEGGARYP